MRGWSMLVTYVGIGRICIVVCFGVTRGRNFGLGFYPVQKLSDDFHIAQNSSDYCVYSRIYNECYCQVSLCFMSIGSALLALASSWQFLVLFLREDERVGPVNQSR